MSTNLVPRRSPTWSHRVKLTRHLLQTGMVAWVLWLIWDKFANETTATSPESFCPFGGFETGWTWITTGRTVSHTHTSNLVLAGVVIILALAARGFFCGWICVLGSIQEGIRAFGISIRNNVPFLRKAGKFMDKKMANVMKVDHIIRNIRYAILVWAITGAAITGALVWREYDPWKAFLTILDFEFSTAVVVLIAVLVLSLFMDRPFCRYACPLGAVQGMISKASPVSIERNSEKCIDCDLCNKACPMKIQVSSRTRVTDATCIGCLECVAVCPSRDALSLTFTFPKKLHIISSKDQVLEEVVS